MPPCAPHHISQHNPTSHFTTLLSLHHADCAYTDAPISHLSHKESTLKDTESYFFLKLEKRSLPDDKTWNQSPDLLLSNNKRSLLFKTLAETTLPWETFSEVAYQALEVY